MDQVRDDEDTTRRACVVSHSAALHELHALRADNASLRSKAKALLIDNRALQRRLDESRNHAYAGRLMAFALGFGASALLLGALLAAERWLA